jgi:hypothetical protein
LYRERIADGFQYLVGNNGGVFGFLNADQDDRKLVAAEPSNRVGLANNGLEPLRHSLKQQIADAMAERVVDVLEVVQVKVQNRKGVGVTMCPGNCLLERLDKDAAVCQSGQDIAPGQLGDLRFRPLGLGHIAEEPNAPHCRGLSPRRS